MPNFKQKIYPIEVISQQSLAGDWAVYHWVKVKNFPFEYGLTIVTPDRYMEPAFVDDELPDQRLMLRQSLIQIKVCIRKEIKKAIYEKYN